MHDPLEGYSHLEWPDLSATRSPLDGVNVVSCQIDSTSPYAAQFVFAAIARLIGAYCGVSDLLFALKVGEGSDVGLVRVSWTDDDSWQSVVHKVSASIDYARAHPTNIHAVKKSLSLADQQQPCIAHVLLDEDVSRSKLPYPVTFAYNHADGLLQLSAALTAIHPSVSEQIVSQIKGIVQSALCAPQSKIASTPSLQSPLMSACERGSDEEVAATYSQVPRVKFAPDYLALRATDSPTQTAVRWYPDLSWDDDEELEFEAFSYAEYDSKANQVARWVLRQGLQPEDRVAVCLDRNLKYHAAVFGIMRAGGCYVPIDPDLPLERKVYIAKDANARFVLTSSVIATGDIFGSATCYFEDDQVQMEISGESTEAVNCMESTALAYLLYTSGTTGNPKGCLLTHHGLAEAVLALSSAAADVKMDDLRRGRYLAVASIAFDVHLAETIIPLALGMPLLSARRTQLFENLPAYVNLLGITHLGIVPSLIEATLNAATNGSDIALRYIASGGEKMSDAILDKWADHPQVRLANFYGPSEVTIGCCARSMTSATPRANIGRAFANVSSYVVDSNMDIVIRGGVGELVVEGPLVGRGYHGRDDLTAKVFMEWPAKGRWAYRTGDLVRMMPDSTIEILGRIDTQIKLRGVRIESEGISAIVRNAVPPSSGYSLDVTTILAKHPAINVDQLVSVISWDKSISIATRKSSKPVVIKPPPGLLKLIKAKCEAELPVYMRPSHVLPLSWLPLSSNGKTDEKVLAQLFKDLGVEVLANIASDESVADSLNGDFSLESPASDSGIASLPKQTNRLALLQDSGDLPFDPAYIESVLPPFTVQEGVLARSAEEHSLYVQHILISCDEDISLPKLREAWRTAVKRQQILRTVFHFGRELSQIILRPEHSDLQSTTEDFPSSDEQDFKAYFLKSRAKEISIDINQNISRVPPYRLSFFKSPNHVFFALSIHHSLFDGIALPCLFIDAEHAYMETIPEPVAPAGEILRLISKIDRKQARQFWASHFRNFTWPSSDCLNPRASGCHHHSVTFVAPLSAVKRLASSQGVTLQALLTGAFAAHAARDIYSTGDVAFGVLRSGRHLPVESVETAALPLLSLVPTRVNLNRAEDALHYIQEGISSMAEYEHLPLGTVQSWIRPGLPLFDVLFSMSVGSGSRGEFWTMIESEPPRPDYALAVEVVFDAVEDTLRVQAAWKDDNHSDRFRRILEEFESTVQDMGTNPVGCISKFTASLGSLNQSVASKDVASGVFTDPELVSVDPAVVDRLRSIIADFLQVSPTILTPTIAFVSLGLDSIKSVGLARLLSKNGFSLTSTELLQHSTLNALANHVATKQEAKEENNLPDKSSAQLSEHIVAEIKSQQNVELTVDDVVSFYPTTALQSGMLSQTINSEGKLYVHAFPMVISGDLDAHRLFTAWKTAVRNFPILRTTFHFAADSGVWAQALHTAEVLDWEIISLKPSQEYASALSSFFSTIILDDETSFAKPPLWVRLFKPSAGESTLVFAMHHALYDGVSIGLLTKAIEDIYKGSSRQESLQFFDVLPLILAQERDGTTFWVNKLRTFSPARLSIRHQPLDSRSVVLEGEFFLAKADVSNVLLRASVTMQCICQAAWAKVLAKHTGAAEVVFGQTLAGRSIPGAEFVVGPTLTTIPCCIRLSEGMRNVDLLKNIHLANLEALPWQHASVRAIQKQLKKPTLWDSLFLFQSSIGAVDDANSMWRFDEISSNQGVHIQYPLNLEILHTDSGIRFICGSQPSYFNEAELSSLVDELTNYIKDIVTDPYGVYWGSSQRKPNASTGQVREAIESASAVSGSVADLLSTHSNMLASLANVPISMIQLETPLSSLGVDSITAIQIVSKLKKAGVKVSTNDILNSRTIGDMFKKAAPSKPRVAKATPQRRQEPILAPPLPSPAGTIGSVADLLSSHSNMLASLANVPISIIQLDTPLSSLGVDSITAIQIVSKLKKAGLKVSTNDILNSRTIGDIFKKAVPSKPRVAKATPPHPLEPIPDRTVPPLPSPAGTITDKEKVQIYEALNIPASTIEAISIPSSGMKWLIGAWQRSHRTRFQHVFPFELPPTIHSAQMRAAWFSLIQRHAILRSTFCYTPDRREPRLITFKAPDEDSWSEECVSEDVFYTKLMERMKGMVANPPPLQKAQARALLLSSKSHSYLILHLHHFQYDAWSMQSLVYDLSQIYQNKKSTVSNDMSSFLQYCIPDAETLDDQRAYWQKAFPHNFKPILFPSLNPNAGFTRRAQRLIRTQLSCIPHASRLEERARAEGLSLQSVFLAVWSRIQAEYTRSSSSTFGLWQSGRTGAFDNIASLAVPCMNVLPFHVADVTNRKPAAIASDIQLDLNERSSVVEQSDLVHVGQWVGADDAPLCNVFVNIVKVGSDVADNGLVLKFAHAPYFVPEEVASVNEPAQQFAVTKLIQDDLFIDIATIGKTDSVLMSIDAGAHMMNESQADALIVRWASEVERVLGLSK